MKATTNILQLQTKAVFNAPQRESQFLQNAGCQRWHSIVSGITFTGKELDAETGYSYFGARYYDSDLSGLFLSVDPMADKYPNISPYAYCAWNPVKLVDTDGREIDISGLSESMQKRLINCLGYITGINLDVQDGKLISLGERNDKERYSKSARKDLLSAIKDIKTTITVEEQNISEDFALGKKIVLGDYHDERYDNKTNGLGMIFFHELGHAFFGDLDPDKDKNPNYFRYIEGEDRMEYGGPVGEAVKRVNRYRREMQMDTRETYERCNGIKGKGNRFNNKMPFKHRDFLIFKTIYFLEIK